MNKQIFETIYHGAVEASCELAERDGHYETYPGSPMSKGQFQYDLWDVTPTNLHDWTALKEKVTKHGVRNSLLLAPMPTASTAQILGNNEGIEAYTSNIYSRRVLSGEFQVKYGANTIYVTSDCNESSLGCEPTSVERLDRERSVGR